MGSLKYLAAGFLAIAVAIGFAGSAQAAPIPWSNPNGTAGDFFWSNGQSDNGLFGSPTLVGNSFLFFPSGFVATSSNGVAVGISDRLEVDLLLKPGKSLTGFAVNELGDYSILGAGGTVSATGLLVVANTDPNGGGQVVSDTLHTNPAMPIVGPGSGAWTGNSSVTILPNGWTQVHIVLNNVLQATSLANSTSTIQKKFVRGGVEITLIVPEPVSISAVGLAGTLLLIRRRK